MATPRKYKIVYRNLHDFIMSEYGSYTIFSGLLGMSDSHIRSIVNGRIHPRQKTIKNLTEFTGKPPEWLFEKVKE